MNTKRHWVLVVDDEPEICELIKDSLTHYFSNEVKVIVANDGLDATRRLPFQAFDCIITDLNMPRKGGPAFIKTARSSQLNEFTPIIVVSGNPDPKLDGEKNYIYQMEKPLNFEALAKLVGDQIKLGRTDKRLNANIVNGMVEAVSHFYEKVIDSKCEVEKPVGKMSGRQLEGEFFRLYDISFGGTETKFVFSMDKEFIFNIQDKLSLSDCEDLKDVVEVFVRKIYQMAMRENKLVKIRETKSYDNANDVSYLNLQKGIKVPFKSDLGQLFFYSLW